MANSITPAAAGDGIDRRGFLHCMAWVGTGVAWTMHGGVLSSRLLGQESAAEQGDFTFVTHNAADFRRLYRAQALHAGLVILVPQSPPNQQRALFAAAIEEIGGEDALVNQALEILVEGDGTDAHLRPQVRLRPGPHPSSRWCITRRRAVKPDSSKKFFVARCPGSAMASKGLPS